MLLMFVRTRGLREDDTDDKVYTESKSYKGLTSGLTYSSTKVSAGNSGHSNYLM